MKRIVSFILAVTMIIGALPIGEMVAWAEGEVEVNKVLVTKTYTGINQLEVMYIEVSGKNLDRLGKNPVIVRDEKGNPTALTTIVENEFKLYYKVDKPKGVSRLSVQDKDYNIGAESMPIITSIEPVNRMVSNKDTLIINGSGFKKDEVKINFYNKSGSLDTHGVTKEENKITKTFLDNTPGGPYRVEFKYTSNDLTIEDNYVDLFTVYGELNVSDDIIMVPNQGPVGTLVKIKGKELTGDMSVFFLKETDGSDSYTVDNRGIKVSYKENAEKAEDKDEKNTIDVFTVKVPPKLEQGRYHVVLTNDVNDENNLDGKITSTKLFENNIFTVVDNDDTLSISDVNPNKGPETGVDAVIQGRYIGTMSPNVFIPNKGIEPEIDKENFSSNILKVSYKSKGDESIGKYMLVGGKDGVDVKSIEREITVFIGGKATFRDGSTFTDSVDKINIRVPTINLKDGEDPAKEVTVVVETTVDYEGPDKPLKITETGTWKNKFIFEPINIRPKITAIVPNKIPVDGANEIAEDFKIAIIGENFLKYRYKYKDENGKDNIGVKYPVLDFGGQFTLNPNLDEDSDIKMFDKDGAEIDGTPGNDLATKILITVPKGKEIKPEVLEQISRLKLTNPIKNEEKIAKEEPYKHMGLSDEGEIKFIKIVPDKAPTITEVVPNTITTDGQKGVKIIGKNFRDNISLYLNGDEIRGIKRNGTGTEIIFDAPKRPEGKYQIILQNEEGDMAVYDDFLYVKTYTNPKIIDFNPKKGTANTLVTIKGENFLPPDPFVKNIEDIGIMKLIGTRVLLGGKDVNEYNLKDDKKTIDLKAYKSPKDNPIIQNDNGKIKLADYYHSVILQEGETDPVYYKVYFNTQSGKTLITNGDKDVYEIYIKDNEIYAKKEGGKEQKLIINEGSIEIVEDNIYDESKDKNEEEDKDKTEPIKRVLTIKTPYATEKIDDVDTIKGNRVKVINNNELYFEVPPMPREGYYDLAIVNPDTKKDERKGQQGFYYSFQPNDPLPVIEEIDPNEGSVDGQYYIDIKGKNFIDRGTDDQKTKVIIGGLVVEPKDVTVSSDGNTLTVKVPKYPGDLEKETDMDRKTVPVVVVNPDGGSGSKEDGFTYVIPISHPEITNLILNKGSAAGGEIVTVEGSDFRFFEPYKDENNNGMYDDGEHFTDLNKNNKWDDLRDKDTFDKLKKNWDKDVLPILPKVYFGGKLAMVKSFTPSTLEVETPKGIKGPVEVYLVNNDHGVSNKVIFNYEASNPKIDTISPNVGRKQGEDKIEILGENFYESDVKVHGKENKKMPVVQFGDPKDPNISNRDIPIDAPQNSGRIRDKLATVKVGNLTVKYDATGNNKKLNLTVEENKEKYELNVTDYDDKELFIPINELKKGSESYNGYEYVRVKLERITGATSTNRLRVDRGFSPETKLLNAGQISLKNPSYYTVGQVPVTLYNPDGGEASISFIYKNPDSNPTITNILRDKEEGYLVEDGRKIVRVNYKGVNTIDVLGSDFRKPVKIKIGDMPEITTGIEYDPDEAISKRMTFKMPPVDEKYINTYHRLVVENEDGGVAGSDEAKPNPIYIHIIKGETDGLAIDRVVPNFGPTAGGTLVTIEGKDFRAKMDDYPDGKLKVYFGDGKNQVRVKDEDIVSIEIDKIQVRTPAHAPGTVSIKVENPDENIVELPNAFTYISNPRINSVVDPENEKIVIDTISVEGGEKIKILGNDFMSGAKVIFNPVIKKVNGDKETGGEIITIGTEKYILESGTEGTEVEVKNSQEIIVTTPEGKIDTTGVMVINPDKGATPIYNIKYGIPEIGAPQNVTAEVAYDQYIKVNWKGVNGATEYEIYVSEDDEQFEYIGSTELLNFVYQKIRSRTKYQFMVRAIGKYGSSKPLDVSKSNTVRTGSRVGPEDDDGKLSEDTIMERVGNTANVIVGYRDFDKDLTIDLTRGDLAGSDEVVVSIPADIVSKDRDNNIIIIGKDYTIKFRPGVFKNSTMKDNRNRDDAGVRFKVAPYKENIELKNNGMTVLANRYMLEGHTFVGNSLTTLDYLNGNMEISLDYDEQKSNMRRMKRVFMARYDSHNGRWEEVSQGFIGVGYMKFIDRLGLYTIIGSRR